MNIGNETKFKFLDTSGIFKNPSDVSYRPIQILTGIISNKYSTPSGFFYDICVGDEKKQNIPEENLM